VIRSRSHGVLVSRRWHDMESFFSPRPRAGAAAVVVEKALFCTYGNRQINRDLATFCVRCGNRTGVAKSNRKQVMNRLATDCTTAGAIQQELSEHTRRGVHICICFIIVKMEKEKDK